MSLNAALFFFALLFLCFYTHLGGRVLLGDWYPTGASIWEGPMCAGLFHAPSGCRAAGTHVVHDMTSGMNLVDFSGCMVSCIAQFVHGLLQGSVQKFWRCFQRSAEVRGIVRMGCRSWMLMPQLIMFISIIPKTKDRLNYTYQECIALLHQ